LWYQTRATERKSGNTLHPALARRSYALLYSQLLECTSNYISHGQRVGCNKHGRNIVLQLTAYAMHFTHEPFAILHLSLGFVFIYCSCRSVVRSSDSSISIVDDRGSIPGRGEEFFSSLSRPDRLWSPPGLLSSGYLGGFFPWE